jgi:AcrR family transcriptional regulator
MDTAKNQPGEDQPQRVVAAAMTLAAERGWRATGLADVARAAGLPLGSLYRQFPTRAHILAALSRLADAAVLDAAVLDAAVLDAAVLDAAVLDATTADVGTPDAGGAVPKLGETDYANYGETPRDRLFDVMMRRFDALRPYRAGLAAVVRDLPAEPLTALAFGRQLMRSLAWMLRAAGIEVEGPGGAVRVTGLLAIHARIMRVFLKDDTADLSRTMAALDAALSRAEGWANSLPCPRRPRCGRHAAPAV